MRSRHLALPLLTLLLLAACAAPAGGPAPSSGPVSTGDRLPEITAAGLGGATVHLAGEPGQALWLSFWASWCVPCRKEWPGINAAARELGPAVRIVGVAVNEPPEVVAAFVAANPAEFAVALDPEGQAAERFGVVGFPTHVLVGADGVILRVVRGPLDGPRAAGLLGLPLAQRAAP